MRPPDENQHGFTRPNFMSGSRRPGGGDDNILARLERDAKRGVAGKSWKHTRAAWCGLAGVLVIGLIGALAVLTRENLAINRKPVLVAAKVDAFEPGGAASETRSGFAPLPVGNPPRRTAPLVDAPPERVMVKAGETAKAPPLVMLKPTAPGSAKPAAARNAPPKPAAKREPVKAAPAPIRVAVAAAAPVRVKKTAPAAVAVRPESSALDSDVALLSAIIMHASRHAGERAQLEATQCGAGKKCPPPNDPVSMSLKATD